MEKRLHPHSFTKSEEVDVANRAIALERSALALVADIGNAGADAKRSGGNIARTKLKRFREEPERNGLEEFKAVVYESALQVDATPQVRSYLNALCATGLYGHSPEDVAERLICAQLRRLIEQGAITREAGE